jgi:hypothetical protein
MELKFLEGKPPEDIHYQSKWMPVYKRLQEIEVGQWIGIEIPAGHVGSAFSAIGTYLRKCKMSVSMKVDKTNVESGIAAIWFQKQEPKNFEPEPIESEIISIHGNKWKVVSVADVNYTGEDVQPLRLVRVREE